MLGELCARAQARSLGGRGPALVLTLVMCVSSLLTPGTVKPVPAAVRPVSATVQHGQVAPSPAPGASQEEQPGPGIERLVARVQQRLQEANDLEARFVQRRLSRFGSVLVERQGRVFIRSPGRMRWEYVQPSELFVTAGEEAYWFTADDNQVQVYQPEAAGASQTPVMYLAGKGDLLRDFEIEEMDWGPKLAPGNIQLHMRPLEEGASFNFLVLEVEPMTATIARLVNVDRVSNTIDYQFHDIEYDVGFPDDIFDFEIPQGADVVYVGG